ncbi:MAG TPA: peptidoglycan DD-metalloendopeptidase family protein [Actinomycetota bacterium]|nr:peptidoglycan DD-metalloendopeptidase family protein [Actinomycetota bacterium]
MAARGARTLIAVVASLGFAVLPVTSRADTSSDLSSAKARLASAQAQLNGLVAAYDAALSRLAGTQAAMEATQRRMSATEGRMALLRQALSAQARAAYESGGTDTIELLLTSDSFSQFSDRVEFLGRIVQGDSDLLAQAQVVGEELRRDQAHLDALSVQQRSVVQLLNRQRSEISSRLAQLQSLVASLGSQLAAQEAAAARIVGGGPLLACPVGQPRAYSDDFGAPRPGGRRHQGIDLMAPLGTPIYAAQAGRFEQNWNQLGGIGAMVFADNGDYTYYAHMSAYAGVPNGAHVPAGTMIGHVGDTGDALSYHLHFEYHPGGGAAVDPYRLLVAVCG